MMIGTHSENAGVCPAETILDEPALVAALREGQEWAFEALIRTYGGRLFAVARRVCGNEEDARDTLQSAYLNAFRSLRSFESSCRFHMAAPHRRATRLDAAPFEAAQAEDSIETLLPAFQEDGHHVEQFSDWAMPADRLLEREDVRATVRKCIAQLPDSYRQVLMLRDIEELPTDAVATMLNATPTAVKVRLHRARQALSTLLRRELAAGAVSR